MRGILLILILEASIGSFVRAVPILDEFEALKTTIQLGADILSISDTKDARRIIYDERNAEDMLEALTSSVNNMATDLKRIESRLSNDIQQSTRNIIQRLRLTQKYDTQMKDLAELMQYVDNKYNNFKTYWTKEHLSDSAFMNRTIKEFITSATSVDGSGLVEKMRKFHDLIIPGVAEDYSKSLLMLMLEDAKQVSADKCGTDLSTQQEIFKLYKQFRVLETKAFAMMKYSYMVLSMIEKVSYHAASEIVDKNFDERNLRYYAEFKKAMRLSSLDIRTCDPKEPKRNVNFIEMQRLYEVSIFQELSRFRWNRKASGQWNSNRYLIDSDNCAGIEPRNSTTDDFLSEDIYARTGWRREMRCYGALFDCKILAKEMEVCESNEPYKKYQYIKADGVTYGNATRSCPTEPKNVVSKFMWGTVYWDDWCVCKCNNIFTTLTDGIVNTVNAEPQFSDISRNKIITGVKFLRDVNAVLIMIKQATLLPNGAVEDESEWYSNSNQVNSEEPRWLPIGPHTYKFLHMKDQIAPKNHVITGIRFAPYINQRFGIEIRYTPVDFLTGKLGTEVFWTYPPYTPSGTDKQWDEPDSPLKFPPDSPVDSKQDDYIEFTLTSFKKDASYSVVPFFDAQPVEAKPSGFPLSGVGLIHKAHSGSGGYFALRIFTFDFADYIPQPLNSTIENKHL